jgi:hypothetical protein
LRELATLGGDHKWQVSEFTNNYLGKGRGPYAYGTINRALGRVGTAGGMLLASLGLGQMYSQLKNKSNDQTLDNLNPEKGSNDLISNLKLSLKDGNR